MACDAFELCSVPLTEPSALQSQVLAVHGLLILESAADGRRAGHSPALREGKSQPTLCMSRRVKLMLVLRVGEGLQGQFRTCT